MDVFADFTGRVQQALTALSARGALPALPELARIVVESPRDPTHGDLACNAAMVLAKELRLKPRDIAGVLAAEVARDPDVAKAEVAGPGFVNLTLTDSYWRAHLQAIVKLGAAYGRSTLGAGVEVNVEYVSANPTGPMHVGHGRGAVVGDAIASLLQAAGYAVTREYYINDAGAQVDVLARSAFLRYREALGEQIGGIPPGLYPGDYLKPVGALLAAVHGASLRERPEKEWLPIVRAAAIEAMMAMIRDDLAQLSIRHDVFFSERSLHAPVDQVAAAIDALRRAGHIYEGVLDKPKGDVEDWEPREQTLFRATAFGDDADRPLMKSDGSYTYFASDIAYHRSKYERGFAHQIDVWGADHGGYVKRMRAAVTAVTAGKADLDVKLCQLVKLFRAGEPVKMSKRSGDFVTLREVVDEVGRDAVRFMMLMRKNDAPLDFDLAKVVEQSKDNPVFYVQYAHARAHSVYRNARKVFPDLDIAQTPEAVTLANLSDPAELAVIRKLAAFPRTIETAALSHEPHRLAFYLHDLSSEFHVLWNRGKDVPQLRFINDDDRQLTSARIALVRGVELVLAAGLSILGVSAPEEMR
jgi:arginyl-tRNA synthetase